jgi:hypothetical protein
MLFCFGKFARGEVEGCLFWERLAPSEAAGGAVRKAPAEAFSFYQTRICTKPFWVSIRVSKLITIIITKEFKIPSFDVL